MKRLIKYGLFIIMFLSLTFVFTSNVNLEIKATGTVDYYYLEIPDTNTYEIAGVRFNGNVNSVTIPTIHNGKPVVSIGQYAFSNCTNLKNVTILGNIENICLGAFQGCSSLTSLTIPDSVLSIGKSAFQGCTSLTSITLPFVGETANSLNYNFGYIFGAEDYEGHQDYVPATLKKVIITGGNYIGSCAFEDCQYLTSVILPSTITYIGSYAFQYCSSLTSLIIPSGVTSIGIDALYDCNSLTSLTIPFVGDTKVNPSYTHFGYIFGTSNSNIPSALRNVTITGGTIKTSALSGCSHIVEITVSNGVTEIGNYAFKNCENLEYVSILSSVTSIGIGAFENCCSLESITIPFVGNNLNNPSYTNFGYIFGTRDYYDNNEYVPISLKSVAITGGSSIGDDAFYDCQNIESIEISASMIGYNAFENCYSLDSVTIENGLLSICDNAFINCGSLISITIPSSVESIGNNAFRNCSFLESVVINNGLESIGNCAFYECEKLDSITLPNTLTFIGEFAFKGCEALTSITIPSSVESIEQSAFQGCTNLSSITLPFVGKSRTETTYKYFGYIFGGESSNSNVSVVPSSLKTVSVTDCTSIATLAFANCTSLTSITIPESLTSLGDSVFENCTSLTSMTLPTTLTTIGGGLFLNCSNLTTAVIQGTITSTKVAMFWECTKLTSVTLSNALTTIDGFAFYGCSSLSNVTLPTSLLTIDESAFKGCEALTSITIPSSVESIGQSAFQGCTNLTNITLPNALTEIGINSFEGCVKLAGVTLPTTLETIGVSAFANCKALTTLEIPSSVTTIGQSSFVGCSSLVELTIPFVGNTLNGTTNTNFDYIFGSNSKVPSSLKTVIVTGGSLSEEAFTACDIENITLPEGLTSIPNSAFYYCLFLKNINIPSTVESIGNLAFSYCTLLKSITIPSSVKTIGTSAFECCVDLNSVTINEGVETINNSAFNNCYSIKSITIPSTVTSIGFSAFKGCNALTSMELPFTGNTKNGTTNTHFGYIFGDEDFTMNGVLIPSSLKTVKYVGESSVSEWAFYNCTSLTSIEITEDITSIGNNAFKHCTGLITIDIPDTVKSMGWQVFEDCTSLTNIEIPENVEGLDNHTFAGCSSLTSISILNNNIYFQVGVFENCTSLTSITLPSNTMSIGYEMFKGCTKLSSIEIPNNIQHIGDYSFNNCTSLTSISIPSNVKTIGEYAFSGCKNLETITIENGLEEIKCKAFMNCESLSAIEIPSSVMSIKENIFNGCTTLTNITLPFLGSNTTSGVKLSYLFDNSSDNSNIPTSLSKVTINGGVLSERSFENIDSLSEIVIGDGITAIPDYAFVGCSYLTQVTLSNSIISIGRNAFSECQALQSFTCPTELISIGEEAFKNDSVLTNLIFNNKLQSIGNNVFEGCALSSVEVPSSVTSIGFGAFKGNNLTCIKLPLTNVSDLTYGHIPYYFGSENNGMSAYDGISIFDIEIIRVDQFIEREFERLCCNKLILPDGVETIPNYAFVSGNILDLQLPSSITSIGNSAFSGFTFGDGFVLPTSLETIGSNVFSNCNLETIVVPSSVTEIGQNAFNECNNLRNLTLPFISGSIYSLIGSSPVESVTISNGNIPNDAFNMSNTGPSGSIRSVVINGTGTSIGSNAFRGCQMLESLTLPNTITSIGEYAFYQCGLQSLVLPTGVTTIGNYAFANSSLSSIILSSGLTEIGDYAFENCRITAISIPETVTQIGSGAFNNCNIEEIVLPNNALIGTNLFGNSWTLKKITLSLINVSRLSDLFNNYGGGMDSSVPSSLTTVIITEGNVGENSFKNCSSITSLTLPELNGSIGSYAFENCSGLTSLTITGNVYTIGQYAFSGCSSLASIIIPNSITTIEQYAFANCSSLSSITLPTSLTRVEQYAFQYCSGLSTLIFPDSVNDYGHGCLQDCTNLSSIEMPIGLISGSSMSDGQLGCCFGNNSNVPSSLKTVVYTKGECLPNNELNGITNITSVTLPSELRSIGNYAFYGCTGLNEIDIPENVEEIGNYAFSNCVFESIYLPSSINTIYENAFEGCTNLKNAYFDHNSDEYCGITFYNQYSNPSCFATSIKIKENSEYVDIVDITVSSNIISLSDYLFYNNKTVRSICLPESITNIGNNMVYGCDTSLILLAKFDSNHLAYADFSINDNVSAYVLYNYDQRLQNSNFDYYTTTDNKVSIISALNKTKKRVNFEEEFINYTVVSILANAFKDYTNLETILNYSNLEYIGDNAFSGCTNLDMIHIKDKVTYVGSSAFANCESISVYIAYKNEPNSWNSNWDNNQTEIAWNVFKVVDDGDYQYGVKNPVNNVSKIVIGKFYSDTITKISNLRVSNSEDNTKVVNEIMSKAFMNADKLEYIYITSGCSYTKTYFNANTRIYCPTNSLPGSGFNANNSTMILNVKEVHDNEDIEYALLYDGTIAIGKFKNEEIDYYNINKIDDRNVSFIVRDAFSGLDKLERVEIQSTVTNIEANAFNNSPNLTIFAHDSSRQENWTNGFYDSSVAIIWNIKTLGETEKLEYAQTNSNKMIIIGYNENASLDYLDCTKVNGYTVESIHKNAFKNAVTLYGIIIPELNTELYNNTFEGCVNLLEVVNKSSLSLEIGSNNNGGICKYAISLITDINNSIFNNLNDKVYYDDTNNKKHLIRYNGQDDSLEFNESVIIDDYAFINASNLSFLEIGTNIIGIKENAFTSNNISCVYLHSINDIEFDVLSESNIEYVVVSDIVLDDAKASPIFINYVDKLIGQSDCAITTDLISDGYYMVINPNIVSILPVTYYVNNLVVDSFDNLSDGDYTISFKSLFAEIDYHIYIDKTLPTFIGLENDKQYNKEIVFASVICEENIKTIKLNNNVISIDTLLNTDKSASDGEYTLYVEDKAGNVASISFIIDNTAPTIKINGNALKKYYNNNTLQVTYIDNYSKVEVIGITKNGNASYSTNKITDEGYYIVTVMDELNNIAEYDFYLDKTNPYETTLKEQNQVTLINFDIKDSLSGIKSYKLVNTKTSEEVEVENGSSFDELGSYSLTIIDNCENSVIYNFSIVKGVIVITLTGTSHNNTDYQSVTLNYTNSKYVKSAVITGPNDFILESITNGYEFKGGDNVIDGLYTLTLTDDDNNVVSKSFNIDTTAPLFADGIVDDGYYQSITLTGKNPSEVYKIVDSTDKDCKGNTITSRGNHTFTIIDYADNKTTITIHIDTIAPQLQVSGLNINKYGKEVSITWSDEDSGVMSVLVESELTSINIDPTVAVYTIKDNGKYKVTVTDKAKRSVSQEFYVDGTAPTITGLTDGRRYYDNVRISWSDNNKVSSVTLNGNSYSQNYLDTLNYEENDYVLVVTDIAGNSKTVEFSVNHTVPVLDYLSNNETYNETKLLTFSNDITNVKVNGYSLTKDEIKNGYNASDNKKYVVVIENLYLNTNQYIFYIDTLGPVISGISNNAYTNKTIEVKVEDASSYTVSVLRNGSNYYSSGSLTFTENGSYEIIARDKVGNETVINFVIDKKAPTITGLTNNQKYKEFTPSISDDLEFTALLNGEEYISGTLIDAEGEYELIVTDKASNVTKVNFTVTKETPSFILKGASENKTSSGIAQVEFSSNVTGEYSLDGVNKGKLNSNQELVTSGTYIVLLTNQYGNTRAITFSIDNNVDYTSNIVNGGVSNSNIMINALESLTIDLKLNGEKIDYNFGDVISNDGSYVASITDTLGNSTMIQFLVIKAPRKTLDYTCPNGYMLKGYIYNGETREIAENTTNVVLKDDGTYQLEFINPSTNNSFSFTCEIDNVVPAVEIGNDEIILTGSSYKKNIALNFNKTNIERFEVYKDGVLYNVKSGDTLRENGNYRILLVDSAGNQTELEFTIDKSISYTYLLIVLGIGVSLAVCLGLLGKIRRGKEEL